MNFSVVMYNKTKQNVQIKDYPKNKVKHGLGVSNMELFSSSHFDFDFVHPKTVKDHFNSSISITKFMFPFEFL